MVLGGESNSRGRGFESKHREIDGHFILINLLPKLLENRRKRGSFFAKKIFCCGRNGPAVIGGDSHPFGQSSSPVACD